jgi:cytochrome b subunit of formate dehydrogenase
MGFNESMLADGSVIYPLRAPGQREGTMEETMEARIPRVALESLLNQRSLVSLGFLVLIAVFYLAIVAPFATIPVLGAYRVPFTVEAGIYAIAFAALFAHFAYRLVRPFQARGMAEAVPRWLLYGNVTVRPLFFVVVGGSYVTGAMVASPHMFEFVPSMVGVPTVPFAINVHTIFSFLLIVTGILLVVFEVTTVVLGKRKIRDWLVRARYPEIKALYWVFAVAIIVEGITGILLLGALSPWGPFGVFPFLSLSAEQLVRTIHGPLGAVVLSVYAGHVYLRLRPEYKLR